MPSDDQLPDPLEGDMPNDRARPHSGVRRERTPGQRSSAMPSRGGGGSCPPPQTTPSLAETAPRRSSRLPLRTQSLDDASLHLMSDYNVASEPTADSASQPDDATHLASSSASQPNAEVRRLALDVIVAINAQSYSLLHDPRLVMERIQLLLSALEAEPEEKLLLESALNTIGYDTASNALIPMPSTESERDMVYKALRQVFRIVVTMHSTPEQRMAEEEAESNMQRSAGTAPLEGTIEWTWTMQLSDGTLGEVTEPPPVDAPSSSLNAGTMLPPLVVNTRRPRTTEHVQSRYCKTAGCRKLQQGKGNMCATHGGGRRCSYGECLKLAQGTTECCARHGGGRRCKHVDTQGQPCPNSATGKEHLCKRHGGGRRCNYPGCKKSSQGKTHLCMAHGGGRRCEHVRNQVSCNKIALSTQRFCRAHGGVRRCRECGAPTKGNQSMCKQHLDNSLRLPSSGSSTPASTPSSTPTTGGTPLSPSPLARGASRSPLLRTYPPCSGGKGKSSMSALEYVLLRSHSGGGSGSGSGSGSGRHDSGTTEPAQRSSPCTNWNAEPSDRLPSDIQNRYSKHKSTQELHVQTECTSRGRPIKQQTTSNVPRRSIELPSMRTAHAATAEEEELQPVMPMDTHCVDNLLIVTRENEERMNSISPEHNGIVDTEMDELCFDDIE